MGPLPNLSFTGGKGGDAKSGVEGDSTWGGRIYGGDSSRVFNFGSGSVSGSVSTWVWVAAAAAAVAVAWFAFRK